MRGVAGGSGTDSASDSGGRSAAAGGSAVPARSGQRESALGASAGLVVFGGQKVAIERPRVRTRAGQEVELKNYRRLQQDGRMQRAVAERLVCGLSTWKYRRAVQTVLDGYGIEKSSVSRHFVRATAEQLRELCERRLEELKLVALLIEFAGQVMVVALGVGEDGAKHVLGLWNMSTILCSD